MEEQHTGETNVGRITKAVVADVLYIANQIRIAIQEKRINEEDFQTVFENAIVYLRDQMLR